MGKFELARGSVIKRRDTTNRDKAEDGEAPRHWDGFQRLEGMVLRVGRPG